VIKVLLERVTMVEVAFAIPIGAVVVMAVVSAGTDDERRSAPVLIAIVISGGVEGGILLSELQPSILLAMLVVELLAAVPGIVRSLLSEPGAMSEQNF
jgi:hypothetical protein